MYLFTPTITEDLSLDLQTQVFNFKNVYVYTVAY